MESAFYVCKYLVFIDSTMDGGGIRSQLSICWLFLVRMVCWHMRILPCCAVLGMRRIRVKMALVGVGKIPKACQPNLSLQSFFLGRFIFSFGAKRRLAGIIVYWNRNAYVGLIIFGEPLALRCSKIVSTAADSIIAHRKNIYYIIIITRSNF